MPFPKDLKDYLPALADQGIPNVCATDKPGVSIQVIANHATASDPETITFADQGLMDMENVDYAVFGINQTDPADPPKFDAKATGSFQMNDPDAADVVDIIIIGRLKDQVG